MQDALSRMSARNGTTPSAVGAEHPAIWAIRPYRPQRNRNKLLLMPDTATNKPNHRWLLGIEPFFEGGWFHKGIRSRSWDVEEELGAVALLGDVTIDLANPRTMPAEIGIRAYAIGRDVEVLVRPGTRVELSGRAHNDHLNDEVTDSPLTGDDHVIKIVGHTFLGDITVRTVGVQPSSSF